MGVPNVLVSIGYAPNDETLNRLHSVKPKYLAERRFYACRQQDDFLKYVNKGIDAGDYLGYAGNPEKSSGIFDARGLMKKSQIKELRTLLRSTDSNIWHAVISFTENFGDILCCTAAAKKNFRRICAMLPLRCKAPESMPIF